MKERYIEVLIAFAFIIIVFSIPFFGRIFIRLFVSNPWLKSLVILLVFVYVILREIKNSSYKNVNLPKEDRIKKLNDTILSIVILFTIIGTLIDISGNFIYNKPLEFILSPFGTLEGTTSMYNIGATYYFNSDFYLILKDGAEVSISKIFIIMYRFIQYLIMLNFIAYIVKKIKSKYLNKVLITQRHEEKLSEELKEKVQQEMNNRKNAEIHKKDVDVELIKVLLKMREENKLVEAIKLLRKDTNYEYSVEEAKEYIKNL
ncbi:hypothetical protein [Miniphocaeibacter massiliensis]|uniref:hypothetical protein n=1 Tax=Miniphocaeibacter massiliensis TaxID=2041841 RepID=UPI000C06AA7F|nr:hypothetical protein [Miniphocaeibacter massiliensis]